MSFVKSMIGMGPSDAGSAGLNFRARGANVLQPVNTDQTAQAYGVSSEALERQQAFLNALAGQNGIGNQSSVFNQQQALANQLQGVANGTGPNPALAQFNQATGANIQNQAALMAGQRGAGANAGLLARQAAMRGGDLQQQAVGEGAMLQAQQQLAGMGALQQQQNMMGGLASNQVAQQGGAIAGYNQAAQNEQQNLLNSIGNFNNANVSMQGNINATNSGVAQKTAEGQAGALGGLSKGLGLMAHGGMVQAYADGGPVFNLGNMSNQLPVAQPQQSGPMSFVGNYFSSPNNRSADQASQSQMTSSNQPATMYGSMSQAGEGLGKGLGKALGSAKLASTPEVATEAPGAASIALSRGGKVKGQAKVAGDSLANDNVPALLSPGEVVIPRSVMNSADPVTNAAKFVQAVLAKNGMRRGK